MRLAHGWEAAAGKPFGPAREDLRAAVRAVPPSMAERLGRCRVELVAGLEEGAASEWTETGGGIEIRIAAQGITGHDAALELLLCLGQALWERLEEDEWQAWWKLLDREIHSGAGGEIDEDALAAKRALLAGRAAASSRRTLHRYARAAFAGTAAEYVHSLWHDVGVRTGPEFLPPEALRRRLEFLARRFPPGSGYRLFPMDSKT